MVTEATSSSIGAGTRIESDGDKATIRYIGEVRPTKGSVYF